MALDLRNQAEGMTKHLTVVIDKDWFALILEQGFKLLLVVLCCVGFE